MNDNYLSADIARLAFEVGVAGMQVIAERSKLEEIDYLRSRRITQKPISEERRS